MKKAKGIITAAVAGLFAAEVAHAQLGGGAKQGNALGLSKSKPVCLDGDYDIEMNSKKENATGIYLPKGSGYKILSATRDLITFGPNIGEADPVNGFGTFTSTVMSNKSVDGSYRHGQTLMEFRDATGNVTEIASLADAMNRKTNIVENEGGHLYFESNDTDKQNNVGTQWISVRVSGCKTPIYMPK